MAKSSPRVPEPEALSSNEEPVSPPTGKQHTRYCTVSLWHHLHPTRPWHLCSAALTLPGPGGGLSISPTCRGPILPGHHPQCPPGSRAVGSPLAEFPRADGAGSAPRRHRSALGPQIHQQLWGHPRRPLLQGLTPSAPCPQLPGLLLSSPDRSLQLTPCSLGASPAAGASRAPWSHRSLQATGLAGGQGEGGGTVAVSPSLWNPNGEAPPAALPVCTWGPPLGSGCPGSSLRRLGEVEQEQEPHCSCGRAGRRFLTAAPGRRAALQPGWWASRGRGGLCLFPETGLDLRASRVCLHGALWEDSWFLFPPF